MKTFYLSKKILLLLILSLFTFLNATEVAEKKKLTVTSKKKFSANESLKFSINTGSKEGFVYIIYIDKNGGTNLLFPNDKIIEKKKIGKLEFPKDFGGKNIKTTKDCKNCKKEKTTIFVLLSDDPIENIQNMNKKDIINIKTKQKNRDISLNEKESTLLLDRIDFFVE